LPGERIEADLRRRLAADEWASGDQLPTLASLSDHYSASRETVARVIRKLADEGLLVIRERWGTFRA
jgi:DNA-binding GntR family transcriptional regulator